LDYEKNNASISSRTSSLHGRDFWYHFLHYAKKTWRFHHLVNERFQPNLSTLAFFSFFSRRMFSFLSSLCSNSIYLKRFMQLQVPLEKLHITGNLKLDTQLPFLSPEKKTAYQKELALSIEDKVIIVASTHPTEEEKFYSAASVLWKSYPNLKNNYSTKTSKAQTSRAHFTDSFRPIAIYSKHKYQMKDHKIILNRSNWLINRLLSISRVSNCRG